ncbi:peptidase M15 [Mycobacterium asiaticum]|uniref:Peptidase M15 n=1 Tax=Mycobacterium asiaticum TaxID=1790 RepID=A0A1A3PDK9_MYCAS|nr:M15 family metallopeptidase [Mycobacterium asiaticum]OBK30687.1 peptidase M15 [Mycobacterium asiaticum]
MKRPVATVVHALVAIAVLVQCTAKVPPQAAPSAPPATPYSSKTATAPSTPTPTAPPSPAAATVQPVTAAELGTTWRAGCPVEPAQLRRVEVNYLGFDGLTHRGQLVVHEDLAADVVAIFEQLYQQGYPVDKMRTVDQYPDADDELSMEDNNTSAFNCRLIPGTDEWSPHAYGRAIDLNPLINPCLYVSGYFEPRNAAAYLDRTRTDPGLIHGGDPAERVFTDRGWQWGGYWRTPDYQHFERS